VDYWRTPKSSYFSLRDQLRPVYAMALLERDETRRGDALRAELYAVNDLRRSVNARVEAVWVDDEGRELFRGEFPAALAADGPALRLGAIEARAHVSGRAVLTLTLHGEDEPFVNRYEVRVR
jgi:beta-mannosidase